MTVPEIDMSEFMVTSRKLANNFDSALRKSIIKHMFLVIKITKKYSL